MKVLFDFSRSGILEYRSALEEIRKSILGSGHTLTNDLLQETKISERLLPVGFVAVAVGIHLL